MDVDQVVRTEQAHLAEILSLGEQRVEGLKVGIAGVVVAADDVHLHAQPRAKRRAVKRVADIGPDGPCRNITVARYHVILAELVEPFDVPVEVIFLAKESEA